MKRLLILTVAAAFIFSTAVFSLGAYEFYRGTITKMSGDKITVRDDKGQLRIIDKMTSCGGCGDLGLKVGDKVSVENGKIIKSGDRSLPSPYLNPQPEPPVPLGVTKPFPK